MNIRLTPRTLLPATMEPTVVNSKLPAWLLLAGVQVVLSSWSDHATRRGLPLAPRANTKRSEVVITAAQPVGALTSATALVGVVNPSCHSSNCPSLVQHPTQYSPQVSIDQVAAGVIAPVSGRATP